MEIHQLYNGSMLDPSWPPVTPSVTSSKASWRDEEARLFSPGGPPPLGKPSPPPLPPAAEPPAPACWPAPAPGCSDCGGRRPASTRGAGRTGRGREPSNLTGSVKWFRWPYLHSAGPLLCEIRTYRLRSVVWLKLLIQPSRCGVQSAAFNSWSKSHFLVYEYGAHIVGALDP